MTLLVLEGLDLAQRGQRLLSPVSVQMQQGQCWGVLGENGVGKSTLLRAVAGLHRPQSGRIVVNGVDISRQPRKVLARRVGMLLQETPVAFPFAVRDCVAAGRYAYRAPWQSPATHADPMVQRAIDIMGLGHKQDETIDRLSGGERRRVAMAALLAQDPAILLLDEPGNHLDLRYQMRLFDHLDALARTQGKLVVMAVHDVNLAARYCTHLMLLYPGGEWEAGERDALLTADRLSRLYSQPIREVRAEGRVFWWPDNAGA